MALLLILQLLTRWPLCHADIIPTVLPDSYPKPWLGVQPAAVVTPGVNVTLRCQAPQPAWRFALFKSGDITVHQNVSQAVAEFFLEEVTPAQGGRYHCCYQRPGWGHGLWSQPSDVLELLVTDELPRPSLEALPGPVVARGAHVSLRCAGARGGMSFALYRVGTRAPLLYRRSALPWADFPLPAARAPGTYSCYYHTPSAPYVLSPRSPPLVVRSDDSLDYTRGNLVRLGLAGLVLIALGTLVLADWRSRREAPGSRRPEAPHDWIQTPAGGDFPERQPGAPTGQGLSSPPDSSVLSKNPMDHAGCAWVYLPSGSPVTSF